MKPMSLSLLTGCLAALAPASLLAREHSASSFESDARSQWEMLELQAPKYRLWVAANGRSTQAVFLSQEHDHLILRKQGGQEVTVPYAALNDDNKQYLSLLFWHDIYRTLFPTGETSFHTNCSELNGIFKERSLTLKIPLSRSRTQISLDRYSPGQTLFVLRTTLKVPALSNPPQGSCASVSGAVFFEPGTCAACSGSFVKTCPSCRGRGYSGTAVHQHVVRRNGTTVPEISETRHRIPCDHCGGKGRLHCAHDDDFPIWSPGNRTLKSIPNNAFCYFDYVDQREYKRIYFCLKNMQFSVIGGNRTLYSVK